MLFHGDLGTAEHVHAILQHQALEDSPWNRCQYVVFIPGLFHLKMAAADVLWHVFIHPMAVRHDDTSLMHDVGILHPKETGIYQSKPGFRHMHQLNTYNCWQLEVTNFDSRLTTLEALADTKPTFTQLKYIVTNAIGRVQQKPGSQHNMQFENALIINKYMLLYEELTHAMNTSDIRRAVHYLMLVNLSGQQVKFHRVDWCVELNNLFIKVINGGKFSNHTILCIILELLLVQVYCNLHGEADMSLTFKELCTYFKKNLPHKMQTGQSSKWCMDDLIDIGHMLMEKTEGKLGQDGVEEDGESFLTLDDVVGHIVSGSLGSIGQKLSLRLS
ncbi:hypothetical protein EDC04DRAFT_2873045 [Pisolithus marmoratus]|nr:hypothetical protein EDC04DRAFT_2873045 [Pisolithus marmoratus]